jgi:putative transposase
MCRMFGVSRSSYYEWKNGAPKNKPQEDAALTEKVRETHERSRKAYSSPRVHAELSTPETHCSRKRAMARLMRETELHGCMRGRRRGTTCHAKRASRAEDLVKRTFAAAQRGDKVWVADITYVATAKRFVYLAFILDV